MSERIESLAMSVSIMEGAKAVHVESVPIVEMFRSQKVWEGVVEVFDLIDHPKAKRCYAWSYKDDAGETRFVHVLHLPPVTSPQTAVRAAIVAQTKSGTTR
jgi:hypothetical protein